jgi:hypothetical protein
VVTDRRLQSLYRLAQIASGPELVRVREAIERRRRELDLQPEDTGLWDVASEVPRDRRWTPGATPFRPAGRDAVPARARRPGERGYRIVGVERRSP